VSSRDFEFIVLPDEAGAFCSRKADTDAADSVVLQNWKLRAKTASDVYDGDFILLFCFDDDALCDESTAEHRTILGVRMSHESAQTSEAITFNSEITQHVVSSAADANKVHEGDFESGQSVCMQTYVIGPKKLTSQIEVQLTDAWLCVVDEASNARAAVADNELVCEKAQYHARLAGLQNDTSELLLDRTRNVSVHHPGAYGLLSVGVCFDANARFIDAQNRTLIDSRQRFESRIRMQPATIRRNGPIHIQPMYLFAAELAQQASRAYDPAIKALAEHAEDQSLQTTPFVVAALRKAIDSARVSGRAVEIHGHGFTVFPADVDDPVVSDNEAAGGLLAIFAILILVGLGIVCWLAIPGRLRAIANRLD
jgi:hypothetical protein